VEDCGNTKMDEILVAVETYISTKTTEVHVVSNSVGIFDGYSLKERY
jgi:hypothetical protein